MFWLMLWFAANQTSTRTEIRSWRHLHHTNLNSPNRFFSSYVTAILSFSSRYHLFLVQSQTQSGQRYTPHLTRFYTSVGPGVLLPLIEEALTALRVKYKPPEHVKDKSNPNRGLVQIRIGGYDKRKLMYKGYVKLENFTHGSYSGTFCLMHRDQVCGSSLVIRVYF